MEYSNVPIPATLYLDVSADNTLELSAQAELVGELFSASGQWGETSDGLGFTTLIEGSQAVGFLAKDGLHWMNAVWTPVKAPKSPKAPKTE